LALAIFDLDNTLLSNDSDFLWGQFLVEQGIVDANYYAAKNDQFYAQYQAGKLDIDEFLRFALKPLADNKAEDLYRWREQFIEEAIKNVVAPGAQKLLDKHRQSGDTLMIISATNQFVTRPIADLFGISILLATQPEKIGGEYSGDYLGTPTFQQGKVVVLEQWLKNNQQTLQGSYFYSDSQNDLPLLKKVDFPVAVDPDDALKAIATKRNWKIISLR